MAQLFFLQLKKPERTEPRRIHNISILFDADQLAVSCSIFPSGNLFTDSPGFHLRLRLKQIDKRGLAHTAGARYSRRTAPEQLF